jgi:hypothetical protein
MAVTTFGEVHICRVDRLPFAYATTDQCARCGEYALCMLMSVFVARQRREQFALCSRCAREFFASFDERGRWQ